MEKTVKSKKASVFEWADAMMAALAALMVVFCFILKPYSVNGTSMLPTLREGDRLIVVDCFYSPRAGDIVVVDQDGPYGRSLVKRVIAVENQSVFIDADTDELYVDGVLIDYTAGNAHSGEDYNVVVPQGCCFLMGDNRSASYDSRYPAIGFIDNALIVGRVAFVLFANGGMGTVQ